MNNETNPIIQTVNQPVHVIKRTSPVWHFLFGALIAVLVIGGFFYWYTLQDTSVNETLVDNPPMATSTEQTGTVMLKTLPISFNLPQGYISFQRETFEGGYSTIISTGKQEAGQHYMRSPLEIFITSYVYDMQFQKDFPAIEYVDIVYKNKLQSGAKPQYIELFGNKAVKYTEEVDGSITIVGYIRKDQLQNYQTDLGVKITSFTYGSGLEDNKLLFDTAVNSMKLN